jgi:DNA mismatch repair protein MSH5
MLLSTPTRRKRDYHFLVRFADYPLFIFSSIYNAHLGILNNTTTSLGRSLLRTWLFRPSLSIPVITARHDAVASFLRPENLVIAATMHNHLKGIKNVPRILGAMRNGKAGVREWQGLVKVGDLATVWKASANYCYGQFTFHSAMIRDTLNELHQAAGIEIIKKVGSHCRPFGRIFDPCPIIKLVAALDVASFRAVGIAVNETVCIYASCTH